MSCGEGWGSCKDKPPNLSLHLGTGWKQLSYWGTEASGFNWGVHRMLGSFLSRGVH